MRWTRLVAYFVAACTLLPLSASAAERGKLIISAERMLGFRYEVETTAGTDGTLEETTTKNFGLTGTVLSAPRLALDWHVAGALSVGLDVNAQTVSATVAETPKGGTTTSADAEGTRMVLGARIAYTIPLSGKLDLALRGGIAYAATTTTVMEDIELTETQIFVRLAPQLLFYATPTAGISLTLNADIPVSGESTVAITDSGTTQSETEDWSDLGAGLNVGLFIRL